MDPHAASLEEGQRHCQDVHGVADGALVSPKSGRERHPQDPGCFQLGLTEVRAIPALPTLLTPTYALEQDIELAKGRAIEDEVGKGATGAGPRASNSERPYGTRQLWRSLGRVVAMFFVDGRSGCLAIVLLVAMCTVLVVGTIMMSVLSEVIKNGTTAMLTGDAKGFYSAINSTIALCMLFVPQACTEEALGAAFALEWRRRVTRLLLGQYMDAGQAYYRLKLQDSTVDNPDQRIGQDVADFTTNVVGVVKTVVSSSMNMLIMSGLLIRISPDLYAYLTGGSVILTVLFMKVFGSPLMRLTRRVLAQEATFRFGIIRVRENAEAIAFYQGASFECTRCWELFLVVMRTNYHKIVVWVSFIGGQKAVMLFAGVVPSIMLGPKVLRGELDYGSITQANFLFYILLLSVTSLLSDLGRLASLGAQAVRIEEFRSMLERIRLESLNSAQGKGSITMTELMDEACSIRLRLDNVTLQPPQFSRPTVLGLSLVLHAGESMLVCGESGIGKSSLLRAVGGLWAAGSGSIARPSPQRCCFIPQDTYLCLGTLRENAMYPRVIKDIAQANEDVEDTNEVKAALDAVNLGHLVARHGLDAEVDWEGVLSGGEKQRLSFARLLLHPGGAVRCAVLDEATSALDAENEDHLYQLLGPRVECFVSVGHRKNLEKFHTHKLLLERGSSGFCTGSLRPMQ